MLSKVMRGVEDFELVPFHERIVSGDRWAQVNTREGKGEGDEWIELMGGITGEKGLHFHQGHNKDATLRFNRSRGVLKSSRFFATNAITGQLLDLDEVEGGIGEYVLFFGLRSSKKQKRVWVDRFELVKADQVSWSG